MGHEYARVEEFPRRMKIVRAMNVTRTRFEAEYTRVSLKRARAHAFNTETLELCDISKVFYAALFFNVTHAEAKIKSQLNRIQF